MRCTTSGSGFLVAVRLAIESDSATSGIVAVGLCLVGALMWFATGHTTEPTSTTVVSARWLGILLLVVGAGSGTYGLVFAPRLKVDIDADSRCIHVDASTRFGTRRQTIPFDQVEEVYVDSQGDTDGGSIRYNVGLRRKEGRPILLHMTGSWDESVMRDLRRQVVERMGRA